MTIDDVICLVHRIDDLRSQVAALDKDNRVEFSINYGNARFPVPEDVLVYLRAAKAEELRLLEERLQEALNHV